MKSVAILVAVVVSSISLVASAKEGKWVESFGQGNLEYFIDKGNARLYIGCPSQESNDGSDSTVSLIIDDKHVDHFKIIVDGNTYEGPFSTATRSGMNSFTNLINDLNKKGAKVVYGKTTLLFPMSNVENVLHTYKSGKLGCAIN